MGDEETFAAWRERLIAARAGVGPIASSSEVRWALSRLVETLGRELAACALRRARRGPRRPSWTLGQEAVVCTLATLGEDLVRLPPPELRAVVDSLQSLVPARPDVEVRPIALGPVGALSFRPAELAADAPVLVHFHGGGYVFGSPRTYAGHLAQLAHVTRARVVAPHYSLAPEAPYPAALEDACGAVSAVLEREDPSRVIITGDSAGGGLALSCLLARRDAARPMPAGVILSSPWVDLAHDRRVTHSDWADHAFVDHFASLLLGELPRDHPGASPARSALHGLPPIRIQLGSVELFREQNERLVRRAQDAGTDAQLDLWPDMVHGFWALGPLFPADRALEQIAAWSHEIVPRCR